MTAPKRQGGSSPTPRRALIVVRLSRVTDATTSPERQLEACRKLIADRGYEEVGIAQDLDVSGSVNPFDRPQLGDWLNNRFDEFDVVVFWRMDRLVRRLLDLADVIRWCQARDMKVVSATESFLDLTHPFGDMIALLVAKVAEMELAAISERNRGAAAHNIRSGKYRGGIPPWGYRPLKDETTGGEWRLVLDPEQQQQILGVVDQVLEGKPLRVLAAEMTEKEIPTPRDVRNVQEGRAAEGFTWHSRGLKRALTSPTLLGQVIHHGDIVRDDDGSPLVRAEPVLTREVFERVGRELADRENRKEPTKRSSSLLVGVVFCGKCGQPAYKLKGAAPSPKAKPGSKGRSDRYRCHSVTNSKAKPCGNLTIIVDDAESFVEASVLGLLGESERMTREWNAGADNSQELTDLTAMLEDLTGLLATGVYRSGTPQRDTLDARIKELAARYDELQRQEVRPAGWTWRGTGESFADWWSEQDVQARNIWLRSMGVRLTFTKREGKDPRFKLDRGALTTLVEGLDPRGSIAGYAEVFAEMTDTGIAGMERLTDGTFVATSADGRTVVLPAAEEA